MSTSFCQRLEYNLMGHLDQRHQGIRSTKLSAATTAPDPMEEPQQLPLNDKTNMVFMSTVDIQGQLFTNQSGQFPITSNRGNNYIVIYSTQWMPMTSSHTQPNHVTDLLAYNDVYAYLHMCDDIAHSYTNLTMSPPMMWEHSSLKTTPASNIHLQKSIKPTLPNKPFAPGKTILLPCMPAQLNLTASPTDLKQTVITLNMMCPCTQNPAVLEEMFSFDATPMAPIGTKCMIHIKPAHRHTWGYHAIKAWYFALALNHYRCIKVVTDTGALCLADTFTFLHHTLPTPTISNADCIIKAIRNLDNTIKGHPPTHPTS
ncbi:LOW QUALITY PROTEIN: hypothetical protein ACHAW6_001069 [Cyclotella cf. meneghiniana]